MCVLSVHRYRLLTAPFLSAGVLQLLLLLIAEMLCGFDLEKVCALSELSAGLFVFFVATRLV